MDDVIRQSERPFYEMSGLERAAILFRILGNDGVKPLLKYLKREEVESIFNSMSGVSAINKNHLQSVINEFSVTAQSLVSGSFDDEQAEEMMLEFERIQIENSPDAKKRKTYENIYALAEMSPESVNKLLACEHPQVWAAIVAQFPAENAKAILSSLDTQRQHDILSRIATMRAIDTSVLELLNDQLAEISSDDDTVSDYNGAKVSADILSLLPESVSSAFLSTIEKSDEETYQEIAKHYISFSDLVNLDSETLQKIFSTLEPQQIAKAICKSSQDIIDKCTSVITKRSATLIAEEMNSLAKASEQVVQNAQQEIISHARRLENNNEIEIKINASNDATESSEQSGENATAVEQSKA